MFDLKETASHRTRCYSTCTNEKLGRDVYSSKPHATGEGSDRCGEMFASPCLLFEKIYLHYNYEWPIK